MPSPVAHQRVGGVQVDGLAAARGHDGDFGEEGVYLARLLVQHVGAVALDAGRVARDDDAQVVLGDDFHGVVVGEDGDVGVTADGLDEAGLNLGAGVVLVVQDAELTVPPLLVQVEGAVVALVEVHAPADEFLYLGGRALHYLFHGGAVAYPVARNHCVLNVFLEVVYRQVGHRGDASLGEVRVGLFHACLADEGHGACLCHFQGEAHPGDARADDEEVEFLYHNLCVLLPQMYANSAFLVPLCADYCGKWLPSRQKETMNRVFHARILPGHYLALGVFAYLLIHAFWCIPPCWRYFAWWCLCLWWNALCTPSTP